MSATGGRPSRQQVRHGGRVVPGLYEREIASGASVFEVCCKRNGKVVRRRLAAETATDAVREQRGLLAKLDTGAHLPSRGDVTLGELRDEWLEWAMGPASTLAPRTVEIYVQRLDVYMLPLLGLHKTAASVTVADLRTAIDRLRSTHTSRGKPLSGSAIRGAVNATSSLFRLGVRRGYFDVSPTRLLERNDRPSGQRQTEPRYLTRPEINRLLDELRPEPRAVAATLAFGALRISEALDLRWSNIDFGADVIHVPGTKTKGSRADCR